MGVNKLKNILTYTFYSLVFILGVLSYFKLTIGIYITFTLILFITYLKGYVKGYINKGLNEIN